MRADAADTFHEHDGLDKVPFLCKLLNAAVVVADEDFGILDCLTLDDQSGMDRFLQRRVIRANRNDVAHSFIPLFLYTADPAARPGPALPLPLPDLQSYGNRMETHREKRLPLSEKDGILYNINDYILD